MSAVPFLSVTGAEIVLKRGALVKFRPDVRRRIVARNPSLSGISYGETNKMFFGL